MQAERRWCLSGTPIQNSIDDLYSYFRFLHYEPYSRAAAFKTLIKEPVMQQQAIGIKRLRAILQVCVYVVSMCVYVPNI
jgi:SNF2 family DNA or RNA helicase